MPADGLQATSTHGAARRPAGAARPLGSPPRHRTPMPADVLQATSTDEAPRGAAVASRAMGSLPRTGGGCPAAGGSVPRRLLNRAGFFAAGVAALRTAVAGAAETRNGVAA